MLRKTVCSLCAVTMALSLALVPYANVYAEEAAVQTQEIENIEKETKYNVGDIIGKTINTDIAAYINHHAITSHNVGGSICIPADELANYGFDVLWNGAERALYITRGTKQFVGPSKTVFRNSMPVGTENLDIYYTDIRTFINGKQVKSYNVGGETLICFDDLAAFGSVVWVPEVRAIKLWVEGIPVAEFKYVPYEDMYKTYPQSEIPEFSDVTGSPLQMVSYSSGVASYKYEYIQENIDKYISEMKYLNFAVSENQVGTAIHYNMVKKNTSVIVSADAQKQLLWVVMVDKGESSQEYYPGTELLTYSCVTGVPVKYTVYFSGLPSVMGYVPDGEGFTYSYNAKELERYFYHLKKSGHSIAAPTYNPAFKESIYVVSKGESLYQIIVQSEKNLMCIRTVSNITEETN